MFRCIFLGKAGSKKPLPDHVVISEPKHEEEITKPYSDVKGVRQADAAQLPVQPGLQQ